LHVRSKKWREAAETKYHMAKMLRAVTGLIQLAALGAFSPDALTRRMQKYNKHSKKHQKKVASVCFSPVNAPPLGSTNLYEIAA